jgi:hypothetical protein
MIMPRGYALTEEAEVERRQKISNTIKELWAKGLLKKGDSSRPRICRRCGIGLVEDNWYPSCKKGRKYICKKCLWKQVEEYRDVNQYHRKRHISISGGGRLTGFKRPWTDVCELCSRKLKMTVYHHWDDNNLMKGLWVCGACHRKIEMYEDKVEPEFIEKWLTLKNKIEGGDYNSYDN